MPASLIITPGRQTSFPPTITAEVIVTTITMITDDAGVTMVTVVMVDASDSPRRR